MCGEKHHSLLHNVSATPTTVSFLSTSASVSTSGSGSAPAPSQPTVVRVGDDTGTALMETAIVLVYSGSRSTLAGALLDSGASVTLVSSRLASSVRAKRLFNPVQLVGMYSSGSSKHTTSLTFSSVRRRGMVCHIRDGSYEVVTPDFQAHRHTLDNG